MSKPKDIVRVYPIRTTQKEWEIPLHCYHKCTERCSQIYIRDSNLPGRFILVDNPDYIEEKCPNSDKLERTCVQLSTFDDGNPEGYTGPLHNPNIVIIPDNTITLQLTYPFSNYVEVQLDSPKLEGFTLTGILKALRMIYEYIYEEEERTSTHHTYTIKKDCENCLNKNLSEYLDDYNPSLITETNQECSICYTNYTNTATKLNCNHIFHRECILRWLENAFTCPLCRKRVMPCDICNKGEITYNYTGAVIPLEYRGNILNRNTTDGVFGIFGHDIDDLAVEYLQYNRLKKVLHVCISS